MAYRDTILAISGLVSLFECAETSGNSIADSNSRNGLGTWNSSGVTLNQAGIPGQAGRGAVLLDGSAGYGSVPDSTSLSITGALTVEAWVKPADAATGRFSRVVAKPSGTSVAPPYNDYALNIYNNSQSLAAEVADATDGNTNYAFNGTTALAAGTWYHLALVYDGNRNVYAYINGVQAATGFLGSIGAVLKASHQPLQIGRLIGGNYLHGTVCCVAVYNVALSAPTLLAHYNAGITAPPSAAPAGVLSYLSRRRRVG